MSEMPTGFEIMTAIAFLYFVQEQCDIVSLEVGLGGRMDSTNVIPAPEVCVVANIGLEHTAILGDTVEKIAAEKCGIIKHGSHAVLFGQSEAWRTSRAKVRAGGRGSHDHRAGKA